MRVYSGSDIGLRRDSNQDYCKTGIFPDGAVWAVVCDGMGGANGGCTASSQAAETISGVLTEGYRNDMTCHEVKELMEKAVSEANRKVYLMAQENADLYGMGTTVVCAVAKDGRISIVHAGDSRAYLYREGRLDRITTDHSVVQELVSAGQLTDEQARNHPNRNIITRALGIEPVLSTDYNVEEFISGNELVICTDGLSGYFSDKELYCLIKDTDPEALIEKLIQAANVEGGSDNITVAVIAD